MTAPGDELTRQEHRRAVQVDRHICRDPGYDPYTRPCRECMSQMSRNSFALSSSNLARAVRVAGETK